MYKIIIKVLNLRKKEKLAFYYSMIAQLIKLLMIDKVSIFIHL